MQRILFVDDDSSVLDGLKRMLRPFRHQWDMVFAASGPEALELLSRGGFDVMLTDMRMPDMNGAELLTEVARRYPQTVRIILSGTWDQDLRMKAAVTAHQYLAKPCHGERLRGTIQRALALREKLAIPELRESITRVVALPSSPAAFEALTGVLRSAAPSIQEAGAVVSRDMAMTAKVLQLANSTFFGYGRHITNPAETTAYLGVESMRALTFTAPVFSAYASPCYQRFSLDALERHAGAVTRAAVEIAKSRNCSKQMLDDTLVAGLLHDIGKLALASEFPRQYDEFLADAPDFPDAERAAFGASHSEIGSYLLWLWGLPDEVVEAVAFHHEPANCPRREFGPLAAVHIADALERHASLAIDPELDRNYLGELGLTSQLPAWIEDWERRRAEQGAS
ncbi:MAG: HDOD domain-containing protein [Acidobacteriia bacterium]|nr:HDOD domain-containing protein [Terriglobia bacterium]